MTGWYDGRPAYYLNRTWRPRQWDEAPVALGKEPPGACFTVVTIKGRAWHEPGCHFWWVWTNKCTGDIITLKCNASGAHESSRYPWERPARHGYCQWPHEHRLPALPDLNDNWSSKTCILTPQQAKSIGMAGSDNFELPAVPGLDGNPLPARRCDRCGRVAGTLRDSGEERGRCIWCAPAWSGAERQEHGTHAITTFCTVMYEEIMDGWGSLKPVKVSNSRLYECRICGVRWHSVLETRDGVSFGDPCEHYAS